LFLSGTRSQYVHLFPGKVFKDACDLLGCLAFSEDHFRHAIAQSTMVIHFCVSEILKRHMPQSYNGIIRRDLPVPHVGE
jgi:hypothetical protein